MPSMNPNKTVSLALMLFLTAAAPARAAEEEPAFELLETAGKIELRRYGAIAAAEVAIAGEREAAANEAFRILFDYISGKNRPKEKIAMTVPVTQEKGEKIAMTVPVTQEAAGETWLLRFMLPAKYSAETAPEPLDDRIRIISLPPVKLAAIRFSGYANDKNYAENEGKLRAFLEERGITPQEPPVLAIYNGPFTLGPWRRNEIQFRLAE